MKNNAGKILEFLKEAEELKTEIRHSYTSNPKRAESVAEHTWFMSLLAVLVFDNLEVKVDRLKVLKMIIMHDLAEVFAGDIPAFEKSKRKADKYKNEESSLKKLLTNLSREKQKEFLGLWQEFEEKKTPEAKLAQSIDKIEAVIQHNLADIKTWEQGDFEINPYYKNDYFDFDSFMRMLKDAVDKQTMDKISAAGKLERVRKTYIKKYRQNNIY